MSEIRNDKVKESASDGKITRIAAGIGFIGLSTVSHFAERNGFMNNWPELMQEIGTSMAHPAFGYYGAWVASRFKGGIKNNVVALGVTTAIDGVIEAGQSVLLDPDRDPTEFLADPVETTKDYIAALSGILAYKALHLVRNEDRTN